MGDTMTIRQLITMLETYEKQLGDVGVTVAEVKEGGNASDRYGIGMGLKVGDIEIKELQDYIQTGCLY